ncbi:lantibiotic immunity ABC transporter MutE/EpiE family permease subunit [Clostridium rectalis]|uniref:lantibiotic immunity ABC transporter MutE/EpiE family permease subunit n=1 Tax=Clostridium rectalis TaxID=2040295 RepID=UPI000F636B96|nr:lantibiotic immunity ABC transporter MutE/EpiE family permease subunit [Clostridium rectalis]
MINMLQSENLKFKRSFSKKFCFIVPMYILVLSLQMNIYFFTNTMNWWSAFFIPFVVCIVCILSTNREKKAGNYRTLKSKDINLKALWISKIMVIAYYLLIASIIMIINFLIVKLLYISYSNNLIPIDKTIKAILTIWITTLILIPICLFIAEALGTFMVILVTCVGIIIGLFTVGNSLWYLCPWALNIRLMCPILKLNPNGALLEAGDPLLDSAVIPIGILVGIVGFTVLSLLTSIWFAKKEAR